MADVEEETTDFVYVTVLATGDEFQYVVPSFPVYKPILKEVKLQWEEADGTMHVFDGFAHSTTLLDHHLPAVAKIFFSHDNAFIIEEQEFGKSVDTANYQFFEGTQVFVIWNWEWLEDIDIVSDGEVSNGNDLEPSTIDTDDDEEEADHGVPAITHSVVFKCIGATKEMHYQELLALASRRMRNGELVPVKLQKEPGNPFDSNAVAFMCQADTDWERIGYVVSEALPDVNDAMDNDKIIKVYFDWIKYVVYFKYPGWYAGITVTRNGNWSNIVTQSCARKY